MELYDFDPFRFFFAQSPQYYGGELESKPQMHMVKKVNGLPTQRNIRGLHPAPSCYGQFLNYT